MNIIGIDPGKQGGVVTLDKDGKMLSYFIPNLIGNILDLTSFFNYLEAESQNEIHIFIEEVHSVFGSSAKANFEFGRVNGIIEGLVHCLNVPYSKVQPKTWQKEMLEGIPIIKKPGSKAKGRGSYDKKNMALIAFERLYPDVNFNITSKGNSSKKTHDGLVDAILIAEYGRRKLIKRRS